MTPTEQDKQQRAKLKEVMGGRVMYPRNENNYLVEVTPEVMEELNRLYMNADEEPMVKLHYSPYWKKRKVNND